MNDLSNKIKVKSNVLDLYVIVVIETLQIFFFDKRILGLV